MKKLAVVAVIALFAGGAAAHQQLPPGGQEFKDGDTAFKKKDWGAAITAFEAAVQANPTSRRSPNRRSNKSWEVPRSVGSVTEMIFASMAYLRGDRICGGT